LFSSKLFFELIIGVLSRALHCESLKLFSSFTWKILSSYKDGKDSSGSFLAPKIGEEELYIPLLMVTA
jgi:hypothetical protein